MPTQSKKGGAAAHVRGAPPREPSGVVSSEPGGGVVPQPVAVEQRGPPPPPRVPAGEKWSGAARSATFGPSPSGSVGVSIYHCERASAPALRPEQQVAGVLVTAQSVTVSSFGSRSARLPASSSLPGVASRNARALVRQVGRHLSTRSNRPRRSSARWSRDASGGPGERPPSVCGERHRPRAAPARGPALGGLGDPVANQAGTAERCRLSKRGGR